MSWVRMLGPPVVASSVVLKHQAVLVYTQAHEARSSRGVHIHYGWAHRCNVVVTVVVAAYVVKSMHRGTEYTNQGAVAHHLVNSPPCLVELI